MQYNKKSSMQGNIQALYRWQISISNYLPSLETIIIRTKKKLTVMGNVNMNKQLFEKNILSISKIAF